VRQAKNLYHSAVFVFIENVLLLIRSKKFGLGTAIIDASKMASEALIGSYANLYNFGAVILRFANIIGPRSQHGVIHDFLNKFKEESGGTGNSG